MGEGMPAKVKQNRAGLLPQRRIQGKELQVQRMTVHILKAIPMIHREDTTDRSIDAPNNMAATSVKQMLQERRREPEEGRAGPALCLTDAVMASWQTSWHTCQILDPNNRGPIFLSTTYGIFTNCDLLLVHNEHFNKF